MSGECQTIVVMHDQVVPGSPGCALPVAKVLQPHYFFCVVPNRTLPTFPEEIGAAGFECAMGPPI
jgi:hypothetical protein